MNLPILTNSTILVLVSTAIKVLSWVSRIICNWYRSRPSFESQGLHSILQYNQLLWQPQRKILGQYLGLKSWDLGGMILAKILPRSAKIGQYLGKVIATKFLLLGQCPMILGQVPKILGRPKIFGFNPCLILQCVLALVCNVSYYGVIHNIKKWITI